MKNSTSCMFRFCAQLEFVDSSIFLSVYDKQEVVLTQSIL